MTKTEASAVYAAYADLEAAAEVFYAAASKMMKASPETTEHLSRLCEDINVAVIHVDDELDEVL
jgi:hypothetical protein